MHTSTNTKEHTMEAAKFMQELMDLGASYEEALENAVQSYELDYNTVEEAYWDWVAAGANYDDEEFA
jgi:carbamoylphosphate synthase large subunit